MQISVALDSPRQRNLKFLPGDDSVVNVTVYAVDGDDAPLTVTDPTLVYGGQPTSLAVGDYFTSAFPGRTSYRLQGTVNGHFTTLAYGVITSPYDYSICFDDYGWCVCGVPVYIGGDTGGGSGGDDGLIDVGNGDYLIYT